MAPFGTIYSYPNNPRVAKIRAVANINGLTLEDAPFTFRETNRTPDFLAKFPLGKVPAFTSADGVNLFESGAIAQYVAESGPARDQLVGSSPAERALIQQWILLAENEITTHCMTCLLPRLGVGKYDEAAETRALQGMERALAALETRLASRTWVATEAKLSLADITIVQSLVWGFRLVIDREMREKYPVVVAYFKRVIESEGVKEAFGEPVFVEKREVPQ
ncbi:glutathione S-transferase family protein [Aspergillus lucknowensis]|uniref:Glutathione S-transferase n=1 Tax=Aspergillus lucknowensis TaxID=176173 RepID=A0ABR4LHP6_9EURO